MTTEFSGLVFCIQWVLGALSPGAEGLGCENNHSPLSSTQIKRMLGALLPPSIHLHDMMLRHRENNLFTFVSSTDGPV
jgi:hypothetical protein